ncbi:hypothetical protein [Halolactibacillus sp. JCM 19043]|uniref:hypothetical protein n=1 Tax=Halolactibacillus sp. JCM 19043 TaxID=1460638 RepID=UPI0012E1C44B|nr:hypothetical protein [Halolactibacillus sp. JCM 19043]
MVNKDAVTIGNAPVMIYAPLTSSSGGNHGSGSNTGGSIYVPVEIAITAPAREL